MGAAAAAGPPPALVRSPAGPQIAGTRRAGGWGRQGGRNGPQSEGPPGHCSATVRCSSLHTLPAPPCPQCIGVRGLPSLAARPVAGARPRLAARPAVASAARRSHVAGAAAAAETSFLADCPPEVGTLSKEERDALAKQFGYR